MVTRRLEVATVRFPVAGAFTISRSSVTEVELVEVAIAEEGAIGRGECRPYPRYGETVEGVVQTIEQARWLIEGGGDRATLRTSLPSGAARNALDCALWDLEAKRSGRPVWALAGLSEPKPTVTAYTLTLDDAERMAAAATAARAYPLLKLKLGGERDEARLAAVRAARPDARLIVDANEGWSASGLAPMLAACARARVELVEQPLPASDDAVLATIERPVPVCADESCHDSASLTELVGRYDMVNLKLDKAGGLTEAIELAMRAGELGLGLMVGCMLASSLSLAPAALLAGLARVVDLDAPLLLARDRDPGLRYEGAMLMPPPRELWG